MDGSAAKGVEGTVPAPTSPVTVSKFRGFVKRRYKWIVLIGSVIISGTLAVKDTFKDQEKEFESQVEAARTYNRLQSQVEITNGQMESIDRKLAALDYTSKVKNEHGFSRLDIDLLEDVHDQLDQISMKIESAAGLEEITPGKTEDLEAQRQHLERHLEDLKRDRENLISASFGDSSLPPESASEKTKTLVHQTATLSNDVSLFLAVNFRVLQEEQKRYRYLQTLLSFASYGLFALGFLLTFFAQHIGNPDEPPEIKLG
jgi:hypothetical protein